MKVFGFFMFIFGWFSLYDTGLNFEGLVLFVLGLALILSEELLAHVAVLFRRNHNE